jgi:ankyrin repeat protein
VNAPFKNTQILLWYGADPNAKCGEYGRTPLQQLMVTYFGHDDKLGKVIAIIHAFLESRRTTRFGDLNLRDKKGQTLLHYAAGRMQSREVIWLLMAAGEENSVNVRESHFGLTPIEEAERVNNHAAVRAIQSFLSK